MTVAYFEQFVRDYLSSAAGSSGDGEYEYFDSNFEWSESAKERAKQDCLLFIEKVKAEFGDEAAKEILERRFETEGLHAPHDFWMTRVGHGVGFWDGDWDEYDEGGKRLTAISKSFNEHTNVERGDDDLLYFS
jgi:hypothetical protein